MNTSLIDNGVIKDVYLKTAISSKTGKEYTALVILYSNSFERMIFPEQSEMFMLKELVKQVA